MKKCHKCGAAIEADKVSRRDECPGCGSDVRVCLNCRFYSPGRANACEEPQVEPVKEKDRSNYCDFFSFIHNIGGVESRIDRLEYERIHDGKAIQGGQVYKSITARGRVVKAIRQNDLDKVINNITKDNMNDLDEVMFMWREAISNESAMVKYYLLYRLMEHMLGTEKDIDEWILGKEPGVTYPDKRKGKKGETTIYTYLRDNIHPKQEAFPFREMRERLQGFQTLVRQCISEKFGIAL